jgi:putative hydrolase of the HAD superfamily
MNELKAIIFDLDDTLYSEGDYVLSGFRAVADWAGENLGIEPEQGYRDLSNLYHQGIRNNTFDLWLSLQQIEQPNLTANLLDIYRNHSPKIEPFPETVGILADLSQRYRIGLVSDGYLNVQQQKWAALQLDHFFDAVVFSDQLGRENWKPSTAPFQLVLEQLSIVPTASVYIGDNPKKDFLGSRQIGMHTIQIKHPNSEYSNLKPSTPDHHPHEIIYSLTELRNLDQLGLHNK